MSNESPYELQAIEVLCLNCGYEFVTHYNSCEASLTAQLAAAQKRIAELKQERAELVWAATWLLSGRGRIHWMGTSDEAYAKQMEQGQNNERAEQIIVRAIASEPSA